jgi:hypothetical protein
MRLVQNGARTLFGRLAAGSSEFVAVRSFTSPPPGIT